MVNVSYNLDIPDAPNNPSNDQPNMKINTNAVNQILGVDHVNFNTDNGGTHKQVTISSKNTPGAQSEPQSTIYTANGSASTVAQLLYRNQNATFPLSALRAFASFVAISGAITAENSYNVTSITGSGTPVDTFTINLASNSTNGNNVIVIPFITNGRVITWSFAAGVLTLTRVSGAFTNERITFVVLQA